MSEFQKQDQLEPKSNGAVQPTEAVELDGYLLDTNTSSGADLSSCLLYTSPSPRD